MSYLLFKTEKKLKSDISKHFKKRSLIKKAFEREKMQIQKNEKNNFNKYVRHTA